MKKVFFICSLFVLASLKLAAQEIKRFNPDSVRTIRLDSAINIVSHRLNIEDFIREITQDTSFYQSFKKMKRYSFVAENSIYTYDKNNKVDSKMYRKIKHNNEGPYRMEVLDKQDAGKIFRRNGKYDLYTVEMFNYIFMNAYNSDFVEKPETKKAEKGNEGYKEKLKTLIFNPGRPIKGIPFIGNKTEIFTPKMRECYDYTFYRGKYLDSIPVYWFKVKVKPNLSNWTKDGLMIKELTTIFDSRNFEILGRKVDMKYSNLFFAFDVQMNIEMSYFGEEKLPTKITYQGNWDYAFKKQERASFLVLHKDYKLGKK